MLQIVTEIGSEESLNQIGSKTVGTVMHYTVQHG